MLLFGDSLCSAFGRFSSQTLDVYQGLNFRGTGVGVFLLQRAPSFCPALGFDREISRFILHESLCQGESGLPGECLVTWQSSCKIRGGGGGRDQLPVTCPRRLWQGLFLGELGHARFGAPFQTDFCFKWVLGLFYLACLWWGYQPERAIPERCEFFHL